MVSIKASINLGLSDALKEAFPTFKIIDPSSLSSFADPGSEPGACTEEQKGLMGLKEGKFIDPY
jgi:hypothetical protein